ncbi:MAG: DnaJ domain-containing protein [Deltaproteobacteria bacterium]|nr:DnaJ domain-containing protein [Deltaproteobacteria bacterium]RLB22139.1 MAG: hypothetical protein DRG76_07390 [Deltaproteobacteria bacterium]
MRLLCIILAIIYALSPYDILPDFLVGWGWIDDIVLLGILYWFLRKYKVKYKAAGQYHYQTGSTSNKKEQGVPRQDEQREKDPYQVLGLRRGASLQDVHKAYRELASKYHPDKVSHLGHEFRDLAEKRFKEINEAYQKILGK